MTKSRSQLRAFLESSNHTEINEIRSFLSGKAAAELKFLRSLSHSSLATLDIERQTDDHFRTTFRWCENGAIRTSVSQGRLEKTAAGSCELVLESFPENLTPFGLLHGDFSGSQFAPFTQRFDRVQLPPRSSGSLASPAAEFKLSADSVDEDDFSSLLDEVQPPKWTIEWQVGGEMHIAYQGPFELKKPFAFQELSEFMNPSVDAAIEVRFEDHEGFHRCKSLYVNLEKVRDSESGWLGVAKLERPNVDRIDVVVRPLDCSEDMLMLGSEATESTASQVNQFLASRVFDAWVGRTNGNQTRFFGFDQTVNVSDRSRQFVMRVAKKPEAEQADACPFDDEADRDFVERIFLQLQPKIEKYIRCKLKDGSLVEDLTQNTFLQAIGNPALYRKILEVSGLDGLNAKFFDNAKFAILDHYSKKNNPVRLQTNFESDRNPSGIASMPTEKQVGGEDRCHNEQLLGERDRLNDQIFNEFLTDFERSVFKIEELSVQEAASALSVTVAKVDHAREKISQKKRVLEALHRLFCSRMTSAERLLTEIDYEILVRTRLLGESDPEVKLALGISDKQWPSRKRVVNAKVDVSMAVLSLAAMTTNSITKKQVEFAEEWLIRKLSEPELAERFCMEITQVIETCSQLGRRIHAQILLNKERVSGYTADLLDNWVVEDQKFHIAFKTIQTRVRAYKRTEKSKTRKFELGLEIAELKSIWETETAVPKNFRVLKFPHTAKGQSTLYSSRIALKRKLSIDNCGLLKRKAMRWFCARHKVVWTPIPVRAKSRILTSIRQFEATRPTKYKRPFSRARCFDNSMQVLRSLRRSLTTYKG